MAVRIAPAAGEADRAWLRGLWRAAWGGERMEVDGRTLRVDDVAAMVAWRAGARVGAATYLVEPPACELVSIDALAPREGIGTALLGWVEAAAAAAGCARMALTTTNDNLDALRFYQRRGYRIAAVHGGAVDAARLRKPSIPAVGQYGISVHDELRLIKELVWT